VVYALAVLAALLVGVGSVVEQRTAAKAPPEFSLSPRLLLWLARRPIWLTGFSATLLGNLVFAAALGSGSVAVVQAVFTLRLLFALTMASAWAQHRVPLRDSAGAVAVIVGLVGFLLGSRPTQGDGQQEVDLTWAIWGGPVVVAVLGLIVVARALGPVGKAALLGVAAGGLYGLQSSLIHIAVNVATESGIAALATNWSGYTVVGMALLGMLLVQSAYEAAPLAVSYPAIVTTELLAGISLAVVLLGGSMSLHPVGIVFGAIGVAAMVLGIVLLTTSPLVTGQLDRLVAQQEIGMVRQIEARLDRELGRAGRDLRRAEARIGSDPSAAPPRRLQRELRRIETRLDRLHTLQTDIGRHRHLEWERSERASGPEAAELAEQDRELRAHERAVDERAQQLRDRAAQFIKP
jgi:type II secretory pathway pseudopilin PulG